MALNTKNENILALQALFCFKIQHTSRRIRNFSRFFWAAENLLPLIIMVSASGLYLPLGMQAVASCPDRISLPVNLPARQTALHPPWQDTGLRQAA